MASRFEEVEDDVIGKLKAMSKNKNTKKSAEYWKNVLRKWSNERSVQENLEVYDCKALDKTLSQFYAELRKESRDDWGGFPKSYARSTGKISSISPSKSYPKSIIRDTELINSWEVLEGKARKLTEEDEENDQTEHKV